MLRVFSAPPMRRAILDLQRAALLIFTLVRFAAAPLMRRLVGRRLSARELGVVLRRAFESLGVTYVKLGQYLALRMDLFPIDVCNELSHLFERARPLAFGAVRRIVEEELGGPI